MYQIEIPSHNIPWPTSTPTKSDPLASVPTAADLEYSFAAAEQAHVDSAANPGDKGRETNAQKLLEWHARADCLSICKKVTRLPRELRDNVYSYLTYEPQVYMTCPSHESKRKKRRNSLLLNPKSTVGISSEPPTKHSVLTIQTQTPKHIWDAQYVGVLFLHEMIDNWYRTATFCINFNQDPDILNLKLEKDQLQFIKRIACLKIKIEDFHGMAGYHETTDEDLDQIADNVQLLKEGSWIQIFFNYYDASCCPSPLGETVLNKHCKFAERVLPWLRKIKRAGYTVSLHIDGLQFQMGIEVSEPNHWIQLLRTKWEKYVEEVFYAYE